MKRVRAFTLIEMLVSLAILAVAMAAIMGALSGSLLLLQRTRDRFEGQASSAVFFMVMEKQTALSYSIREESERELVFEQFDDMESRLSADTNGLLRLVSLKGGKPLTETRFPLPTNARVDWELIGPKGRRGLFLSLSTPTGESTRIFLPGFRQEQ